MSNRPSWEDYWATVGNEAYLMVRTWLEASPTVRNDAAQWVSAREHGGVELDWVGWFTDVEESGRGWSSTETRLFKLARQILWTWNHPHSAEAYDRECDRWRTAHPTIDLEDVLGGLGSWEQPILTALVEWASGGRLSVKAVS